MKFYHCWITFTFFIRAITSNFSSNECKCRLCNNLLLLFAFTCSWCSCPFNLAMRIVQVRDRGFELNLKCFYMPNNHSSFAQLWRRSMLTMGISWRWMYNQVLISICRASLGFSINFPKMLSLVVTHIANRMRRNSILEIVWRIVGFGLRLHLLPNSCYRICIFFS